jgi:hypothetical protein
VATYYGSATLCVDDLPLISTQTTSAALIIGQRTARRLTTPRGALALIGDDPNFGFDVRQYINAKLSPLQRQTAESNVTNEVLKDDQIESAQVAMVIADNGNVSLEIKIQAATGPFTLTLNVSQMSAALAFNFTS